MKLEHKITWASTNRPSTTADSPRGLVENMKESSVFLADQTVEEYMNGWKTRAVNLFGSRGRLINVRSPFMFLVTAARVAGTFKYSVRLVGEKEGK
jgi:hypothetical protein